MVYAKATQPPHIAFKPLHRPAETMQSNSLDPETASTFRPRHRRYPLSVNAATEAERHRTTLALRFYNCNTDVYVEVSTRSLHLR